MSVCQLCNGSRTMKRFEAHGEVFVACPSCGGRGRSKDKITAYYVIWFNRQRRCIELHKPFCEHGVHKDMDTYYSLGGDSVDPKEMVKTLPDNYRTVAVMIEDCLQ